MSQQKAQFDKKQQKKQEEFEEYEFDNDPRWKQFIEYDLKDQIPKNASQKIIKDIQKMWYKQTIDPDFETGINFDEMDQKAQQQNEKQQKQEQNQQQKEVQNEEIKENDNLNNKSELQQEQKTEKAKNQDEQKLDEYTSRPLKGSRLQIALFNLEFYLKILFISQNVFFPRFSHYMSLIICLLAIYRQLKRPKLQTEYFALLMRNEFAHNLIYMIPFSIFSGARSIIYFLPLMVHYWLGICQYFDLKRGDIYKKGEKLIVKTIQNKANLFLFKAKLEVYMVGYYLFLILVWSFYSAEYIQQNILLLVFYVNFLRIKYMMSIHLQTYFAQLNSWAEKTFNCEGQNFLVRWTFKKVQQFCKYMVKFEKKQQQQQHQHQHNPNDKNCKDSHKSSGNEQVDKKTN